MKNASDQYEPVHEVLIDRSADGNVIYNDDTTQRILGLTREQRAEAISDDEEGERTGVFTSGIVSTKDGHKIALFFSGAPMGGDLPARPTDAKTPSFAIWATKDPNSGNLDRAQVIKVWEEDGKQKEHVFDVVWADRRLPDSKTGKIPTVGDTVNLKTGKYSNDIGAAELKTVWTDPEFDPHRLAAYYLRVLEIPTPRWSTLLAIQTGLPLRKDAPPTTQQRGWSSPIWFGATGIRQADCGRLLGGSATPSR